MSFSIKRAQFAIMPGCEDAKLAECIIGTDASRMQEAVQQQLPVELQTLPSGNWGDMFS